MNILDTIIFGWLFSVGLFATLYLAYSSYKVISNYFKEKSYKEAISSTIILVHLVAITAIIPSISLYVFIAQ